MLRIATRTITLFVIVLAALALPAMSSDDGALSFEERVRYQRLIEDVYWQNRIWPEENPGLKPALDEVMPDAVIRERVQTYLEKSAALEKFWSRPLTGEQLQAEMDRMVSRTKSPEMLAELFAALDDDPFLIAECLARPVLVDRLTRNWYARDTRFHGTLKEQAETSLAAYSGDLSSMPDLGDRYEEVEFRLVTDEAQTTDLDIEPVEHSAIDQNAEEWREKIERIAALFGIEQNSDDAYSPSDLIDRIPLGSLSRLVEENDRFLVTSVLSIEQDHLKIATVTWNKRPFDAWWAEEGRIAVESSDNDDPVSSPDDGYKMRWRHNSGCSDDTWAELWYVPSVRSNHTAIWTGSEMIVWGGEGAKLLNSGGKYDPATDSWTPTSIGEGVPSRRDGHTAVWTGTEMIIWGGDGGYTVGDLNTGGRYNPATNSWVPTSYGTGVVWRGRSNHTAIWTGTEMIIWGGYSRTNTGGRYDPETDSWLPTSTGDGVPSKRESHTAVWTGSKMVIWGGYGGYGAGYLNTGGQYDPASDSWEPISTGDAVPPGREDHTVVWTGSKMIVWGGFTGQPYPISHIGGLYDPVTDSWTATSIGDGVPLNGLHHSAIWTGMEMIIWGGFGNLWAGSLNTGGRYNPATDSWTTTSTMGNVPGRRHSHTAVWTGSEMIVWGGVGFDQLESFKQNTGGRYDPETDSWVATSEVPTARSKHTAVWTGAEMIVWGGYKESSFLNTGEQYDPAIDNWTVISTGDGVPSGRISHTAVWTGTEMITWGGKERQSYTHSGGRYDPVTDSWTATSIGEGVPSERMHHTAVWTGSEMIVWGGFRYDRLFTYLNTGGRYDPASDSWTTTSIGDGVPTKRYYHTAVWTDTEMIVWGGYRYDRRSIYLNTGGRYDPASDSWTATAIGDGVPAERQCHTAVWTGSEMIVWGGIEDWSRMNTGGRYDPVTDSWTATAIGDGAPSPRDNHTAVWTGSEMIVWGGGYAGINTGGRYDPATDCWTATSTGDGVPSKRKDHTAVWTGTEMIVWGGDDGRDQLISGGLYCACEGVRERVRHELHEDPDDGP